MLNEDIIAVDSHKHLGVFLSNDGKWQQHIESITSKAWKRINLMRKLKFLLNWKSLETIYFSFIRPILEYADVVWTNCTIDEKYELDKIQNEAMRIVTGATKLVSIDNLYKETGWDSLEKRRNAHKLVLFYKILNNQTPHYLKSLIPPLVSEGSSYTLRNGNNIQIPFCRSQLYSDSFIPSSINLWNALPDEIRNKPTLSSFKHAIRSYNKLEVPKFYCYGDRVAQILHCRLRTNCSSLNLTLFQKGISQSPLCTCGEVESAEHYFLRCHAYDMAREELLRAVNPICVASTKLLLFGDKSLSYENNVLIFNAVHKYIILSHRFDKN